MSPCFTNMICMIFVLYDMLSSHRFTKRFRLGKNNAALGYNFNRFALDSVHSYCSIFKQIFKSDWLPVDSSPWQRVFIPACSYRGHRRRPLWLTRCQSNDSAHATPLWLLLAIRWKEGESENLEVYRGYLGYWSPWFPWPLLLRWINFNPSMDK